MTSSFPLTSLLPFTVQEFSPQPRKAFLASTASQVLWPPFLRGYSSELSSSAQFQTVLDGGQFSVSPCSGIQPVHLSWLCNRQPLRSICGGFWRESASA